MRSASLRRVPGAPRLLVAPDGGRRTQRIRHLAGTSDWRRALLDRVGTAAVAVVGTSSLPDAPPFVWPPVSADELTTMLDAHLPGIRLLGAVVPRQAGRRRLTLLADAAGGDVVIKLGVPDDGIEQEASALRLLTETPLPCIATPRVLASGTADAADGTRLAFVATDALGLDGQRPAIGERLGSFERDLAASLAALPRPEEAGDDAVPVHGDLAPWNLRRTNRGLALFDWEAAGWGRPGTDVAHYRAACAALRPRRHA